VALQFDLIKKSPVRAKRHSPKAVKITKPTLTGEQIYRVIHALKDEQERLALLLLASTGLRVNEALALRWIDFSDSESTLSINHTIYKGELKNLKTDASKAVLELDLQLTSMLVAHRKRSDFRMPLDFIFACADGSSLRYFTFREHLQNAMKAIG